jgi:50S ribosomal protein L16 3-hydroxylase
MTGAGAPPLGGRDPAGFLAAHWQKRPLLIRGAMPGWKSPLTPDELAGLACEEEVESRIVSHARGRWSVRHGPFEEADFARLPTRDWTLLVQGVDRWIEPVAALRRRFRFVPDWRVDDVMVSYAPPGGGVGAHVDAYDVFLLQGLGRRRWRIGGRRLDDPAWLPDQPLKLLADFVPAEEHVLEEGDMLYLPPGWAHDGIAETDCLTFSVGFRAPSTAELAGRFAAALSERFGEGDRYADPDLEPPADPGEITGAAVAKVQALLRARLDDPAFVADWLGALVTEPKDERPPARVGRTPPQALACAPDARLAWTAGSGGTITLFADGAAYRGLAGAAAALANTLCRDARIAGPTLEAVLADPGGAALLDRLRRAGSLVTARR